VIREYQSLPHFYFARFEIVCIFAPGEMAERSIAAVLKTVDLQGSGGSNPSLSATEKKPPIRRFFYFDENRKLASVFLEK
jgi:hypothetical protein